MERYIAYRVEREIEETPRVWTLYGYIADMVRQSIGNFYSQCEAFEVLERISGIRGIKDQEYYPAEVTFRQISAGIHYAGISESLIPYAIDEYGHLTRDADESDELLFMVRATQTFFWRALRNLELHLGFEIDSRQDFKDASIVDLKSAPGAPV